MIGRRATDAGSPGFVAFLLVTALAVAAAILTWLPPTKIELQQPVDACVDGVVKSWDGKQWHAVKLKNKGRPVPCEVSDERQI